MAKSLTQYVCQSCGATAPKWQGQCVGCGAWNSLVEEIKPVATGKHKQSALSKRDAEASLVSFPEVELASGSKERFSTTIGEFDRVLGGGLVDGMVVLVGGEPGVGKSTLLTQMVLGLLSAELGTILYVAGEESPSQISLRINRILRNESKSNSNKNWTTQPESLQFFTATDVDLLTQTIAVHKPNLVIVDSIQSLSTQDLSGASGSIGQLREVSDRIISCVKPLGIPTVLVGHVTKEGSIAGPKVLEHMVDTVLELSGERSSQLRLLRALKNRFGATDEVGVFQLTDTGIVEVNNPSELFLEQREGGVAGSATVAVLEGTRPLLAEVQALVVDSQLAMPRRVGRGIELSRIQVLSAVLQKHARLPLGSTDIFVNAAGGFYIKEPAVDLGVAVAIASSLKNKKIPQKSIFIGEIGLLGEIRAVSFLEKRIKEARRLGFTNVYSRQTHSRVDVLLRELGL